LQQTVGVDYVGKNVRYKTHLYRLQLWDTAGQEKFRSLIPAYIRGTHCAVFVYDVSNQKSFEKIQEWHDLFKTNEPA
jgi:small GTP-binding protein